MLKRFARGLALAAVLTASVYAPSANAALFGFDCITNNKAADCATGEAQLFVDVTAWGSNQVSFLFTNAGPNASSITDVYFDFGAPPNYLTTIAYFLDSGAGVSFSQWASPRNLPGGNTIGFTADRSADSNSPTQPNGVNPGEWLRVVFNLASGGTLQNVIDELGSGSPSWLRVGIHVQGFAGGGSESFVNVGEGGNKVPEPGTLALLAGALGVMGLVARRRRS